MVELTDREKKIIIIKYIIHGVSPYAEEPIDTRVQMMKAFMNTLGLKYENDEMMDIANAILQFQQQANDSASGFLQINKGLVDKALDMMKGNDRLKMGGS